MHKTLYVLLLAALSAGLRPAEAAAAAKADQLHQGRGGQGKRTLECLATGADRRSGLDPRHGSELTALVARPAPQPCRFLGPNDYSLLNLTLRRVDKEVDLGTLATTPSFNSSTLAAARYTAGWGAGRDFYAIAEVSNASQSQNTLANAAFKYALGVDKKLGENMWLELRLGRSRVTNGSGEETAALLNLKIAPSSGVATLAR